MKLFEDCFLTGVYLDKNLSKIQLNIYSDNEKKESIINCYDLTKIIIKHDKEDDFPAYIFFVEIKEKSLKLEGTIEMDLQFEKFSIEKNIHNSI